MLKKIVLVWAVGLLAANGAAAQTTVTTASGSATTTGTIPVFASSSTIENSGITQLSDGTVSLANGQFTVAPYGNVNITIPSGGIGNGLRVSNTQTTTNTGTGGIYAEAKASNNLASTVVGIQGRSWSFASSGQTVPTMYGILAQTINASYGTVTNAYGMYANVLAAYNSSQPGTITNAYGIYVDSIGSSVGTINNAVALYLASPATTTNKRYSLYQTGNAPNYFAGNLGIGTAAAPSQPLEVAGNIQLDSTSANSNPFIKFSDGTTQTTAWTGGSSGYMYLSGNTNPTTTAQGTYLGWNALTGGTGETDFINNPGTGSGGFAFMNVPSSGSPRTTAMFISGAGNVGIGTTTPGAQLEVHGNVKLTANSGGSITFQDGTTQSTAYTGVTCGGDYAESVDVTGDRKSYEPGDVLVLDEDNPGKMLKSIEAYATSVSGVYSTKPGTVGRRQTTPKSPDEVPMAVVGIVPAKVSTENGPIKVGDLLVSSSTPGYAMKGTDRSRMLGAVVGKAMAKLDSGTGVIEVLVTLQ